MPITSILFLDHSVKDSQILLTGLNPEILVVSIPNVLDGIEYITDNLPQPVKNLYLVSHGSPGCLYLGNTQLNLQNIETYATYLQQWQVENILIYGCKVAVGDAGTELIEKLHKLTGANIAASSTPIGNSNRSGNWELDVIRGEVNTSIPFPFTQIARETYTQILEVITVNTLLDEDDGVNERDISLRDAINRANSLPGKDIIRFDSDLKGGTISLVNGALDISNDLTISGLGENRLTIDAVNNDTNIVFNISDGLSSQINVRIGGLSIINSTNLPNTAAIVNLENLKVDKTLFSGNSTGIFNNGALSITNTTFLGDGDVLLKWVVFS